jgi:hypothetical protein
VDTARATAAAPAEELDNLLYSGDTWAIV